jgi:3-deoxy-D-manno-octulosonic-acid transferase
MSNNKLALKIFWILYNGMLLTGVVLLLPLIAYTVATTSKRKHTFRHRMGWRVSPWGNDSGPCAEKCIWVHALSVGEVLAAQPLVSRLRRLRPDSWICFTASTHTGFQTARRLFGQDRHIGLAYFPYDWIGAVRRVVTQINPSRVVLTETDIWPNFLMEMHRRHVPVSLVNLRLSEGSWRNYKRFGRAGRYIFSGFEKITVQDQLDMARLISFGIDRDRISVTGNIKFDGAASEPPADAAVRWKRRLNLPSGPGVLVAGSTHPGEESLLLEILRSLGRCDEAPVLILAPRDPLRSQEIVASCDALGLDAGLMTAVLNRSPEALSCPRVVVVDTIGVLKDLYSVADVAFVGGSLVPCGGHNPIEPAVWGKPVLFGPDMRDFGLISRLLLEAGAARQVGGSHELRHAVRTLLADPRLAGEMGRRGLEVVEKHKGSVGKTLEFLGILKNNHDVDATW